MERVRKRKAGRVNKGTDRDRSGDFKVYGPWMVAQRRYRRNSAAKQTSAEKALYILLVKPKLIEN